MAAQARRTIPLADSSKYGNIGFAKVLPLGRIDTIITDCGLRDEDPRDVEEPGIDVMTV